MPSVQVRLRPFSLSPKWPCSGWFSFQQSWDVPWGSPRKSTREFGGPDPSGPSRRRSQAHASQSSPESSQAVPFLSTFAARSHLLRGAGLRGEDAQAPLQQMPLLEVARAHGSGLSAFVCCSARASWRACCCHSFRPPRLVIPSLHVYANRTHHPREATSPSSGSLFLGTRSGDVWRGPGPGSPGLGPWREAAQGQCAPVGAASLSLHPRSPPSLWSLPFLIYKDIQRHARASRWCP